MIFKETKLRVADNSGAKKVLCIKVLSPKGVPGALLITTIKRAVPKKSRSKKKNLKKGEIHKALLVSTKKGLYRKSGLFITARENFVIILRKEHGALVPYGNRILRSLYQEVRKFSSRIAMMAPHLY